MIKQTTPSVFIGLPLQLSSVELDTDYNIVVKNFFQKIIRPSAIILVSPFWQTTKVIHITANDKTKLSITNPTTGPNLNKHLLIDSNYLANQVKELLEEGHINTCLDYAHEIEPNSLAILLRIYPDMDIPIVQVSLPLPRTPQIVLEIGRILASLRKRNILLLGIGNIVHNTYEKCSEINAQIKAWALEFDAWVRMKLTEFDRDSLSDYKRFGPASDKAVPEPEYYDPFLFIYGTLQGNDEILDIYSGFQYGTLSLRSVAFGLPESLKI